MSIYKQTTRKININGIVTQVLTTTTTLNLDQFYLDAASLGATVDSVLFNAQIELLPTITKDGADYIIVPGVHKLGYIIGFNVASKSTVMFPFSRSTTGTYFDKNGVMQIAPINLPRIDYNPISKVCNGYLLENASTNLLLQSNTFNNTWSLTSMSGTSTAVQNDGTDGWTITLAASAHILYQTVTVVPSTVYTFSFYAKTGTMTDAKYNILDATNTVDIVTGTSYYSKLNSSTYTRITVTFTIPSNCTRLQVSVVRDSGVAGTIFVKNAQLEVGSTATSYIPTTTSTVTRASDILTASLLTDSTLTLGTSKVVNSTTGTHTISDSTSLLNSYAVFSKIQPLTVLSQAAPSHTRAGFFIDTMRNNMKRLGAIFNETAFTEQINALNPIVLNEGTTILVPGAYNTGIVYGSDINGLLVPFTFSRASTATYIDVNGVMQTAPANMPRIDYNPLTKVCKGYLQESYATNMVVSSNDLAWSTFTNTTVSTPTGLAPDNTTTARKIIPNTTTNGHFLGQNITGVAGTTYTFSCYAKAAEYSRLVLMPSANTGGKGFDLIAGTTFVAGNAIQDTSTAVITNVGNGWFRCSINVVGAFVASELRVYQGTSGTIQSYAGDGVGGIYVWGCQVEVGLAPTSLIPTTTTTVSRQSDIMQSVTDILTDPKASLYYNFASIANGNGNPILLTRGGGLDFVLSGTNVNTAVRTSDGTNVLNTQGTQVTFGGTVNKACVSWGTNLKLNANGNTILTSSYDGVMQVPGILRINDNSYGPAAIYTRSLAIIPRQLTDAEHITITT